jgi:hypothetical protein
VIAVVILVGGWPSTRTAGPLGVLLLAVLLAGGLAGPSEVVIGWGGLLGGLLAGLLAGPSEVVASILL